MVSGIRSAHAETMTTTETPPSAGAESGPRVSADEARDLTRLRRTTSASPYGRRVAGVAGGIARHLDVDPLVVRVALVVLVFFGGAGLLLYVAAWLLVPEEGAHHAVIRLDDRSRNVVLWVVAALAALAIIGESLGRFNPPWPLILVGLFALWVLTRRRRYDAPAEPTVAVPPTTDPDAGSPSGSAAVPAAESVAGQTGPVDLTKAGTTQVFAPEPPVPPGPPGPPTHPAPPYRRGDPRKTGPVLFWVTLALVALAEGVLGIIDVAGATIPSAAYPALALGLIGAMLVLGAFVGRAGGLIALGLVATLILVGSGINDRVGTHRTLEVTPSTAAAVAPSYHVGAGRITLDLSQLSDLPSLAGRRLDLSANVGKIDVVVPPGLGVDLQARVHGVGDVRTFGEDHGGFGITYDHVYAGHPMITVVADVKVGQIELRQSDGGTR